MPKIFLTKQRYTRYTLEVYIIKLNNKPGCLYEDKASLEKEKKKVCLLNHIRLNSQFLRSVTENNIVLFAKILCNLYIKIIN